MAHIFVDLYDRVDDSRPRWILDDKNEANRIWFHDLNEHNAADKAARVRLRTGNEYRTGDHVRLLDNVRQSNTANISIDPDVSNNINLNELSFADKAAAVKIVSNPNDDGGYRLRVLLYDRVGQQVPHLILYDWEFGPPQKFADLNLFHFADKAAFIRVERGPNYRRGDRIHLWDRLRLPTDKLSLEPGAYDLNANNWADKAAGVEFDLEL